MIEKYGSYFLGLLCERGVCCHCHGPKNHMLSCRIVIHKSASNEEALLLKINVLLRMWENLRMCIKFFVIFMCQG